MGVCGLARRRVHAAHRIGPSSGPRLRAYTRALEDMDRIRGWRAALAGAGFFEEESRVRKLGGLTFGFRQEYVTMGSKFVRFPLGWAVGVSAGFLCYHPRVVQIVHGGRPAKGLLGSE